MDAEHIEILRSKIVNDEQFHCFDCRKTFVTLILFCQELTGII